MKTNQKGFTLIEILISAFILSMVLVAFISSISSLGIVQLKAKIRSEAVQLSREYLEIAYSMSLQDWEAFSTIEGTYTFVIRDTPDPNLFFPYYEIVTPPTNSTDKFIRTITFTPSVRASNGSILEISPYEPLPPGSTIDPQTRRITVTTKWNGDSTIIEDIHFTTYLMNFGIIHDD